MKPGGLRDKFELYILSLWLLFLLIILITIDVPICISDSCKFIGFSLLLKKNIIPFMSFIFLTLGIISYLRFNYRISGSKKLPSKIVKII